MAADAVKDAASGKPTTRTRFLLKLGFEGAKDPSFDPELQRDDVTGEAYPYRLQRLIVLLRSKDNTQTDAGNKGVASVISNKGNESNGGGGAQRQSDP